MDVPPPGPDYRAASEGATARLCRERRLLEVVGGAPGDMLNGMVTNRVPGLRTMKEEMPARGFVAYSALLTPKGKMLSDMRIFRNPGEGFLLDLPENGCPGAVAHFKKFLPPRMATLADRSEDLAVVTVLGPTAPLVLSKVLPQLEGMEGSEREALVGVLSGLPELGEGEDICLPRWTRGTLILTGNGESRVPGWDLVLSRGAAEEVLERLSVQGVVPLTPSTARVLRLEKGRPAFGEDMNEDTIPLEAGIQRRAIDSNKGCYIGQEVIIRLRDRGRVNKELRGILLGDVPVPPGVTDLFQDGVEKSVGWITSAVASPAFRQTIALGYVRRGIERGDRVRLAAPTGPEGRVVALSDEGWLLDESELTGPP